MQLQLVQGLRYSTARAQVDRTGKNCVDLPDSGLAKPDKQVQDWAMLIKQIFPISDVRVPAKRKKSLDPVKVQEIAEDMLENGQTTPIRLRSAKTGFVLIEGFHRLEALRSLGEDMVEGYLVRAQLH
ncbi:ParB N-terminal domain-containing protein [Candidatus Halocynthiibacter alkanivorans]|uniref:ParB N-terminal domain-containing protein n=1 Tax=Candidatus Halocynthiibacter alkanivorans TaxID=2267619 RepID=UPI001F21B250|nr:ParB N-terminal domain-containing protein [Candidatus Halocynthiibacter alkanivorans]